MINATIAKDGALLICRALAMVPVKCIYSNRWCSDACAMFGTPIVARKKVRLELCVKTLVFDSLRDERLSSEAEQLSFLEPLKKDK